MYHHKITRFEFEKKGLSEGIVEGYASVFNVVDSYEDLILPGAFDKSLKSNREVKFLWQHRSDMPIGKIEKLSSDNRGLYFKGKLTDKNSYGRDAKGTLEAELIDGVSIGFRTKDSNYINDIRHIKEIDLFELSLVTFPANENARVVSYKGVNNEDFSERDIEKILRDAGISRKQAKAITCHGFKNAMQRDAVKIQQMAKMVRDLNEKIGGQLCRSKN